MGNEIIDQQQEAQDSVFLSDSINIANVNNLIDEEELDPITKAIRQEILQKQRNILKEYISENLDPVIDKYEDQEFINYLRNINNRVIIDQAFSDKRVKAELEKIEIAGYKTVQHNFADQFQAINWQDSDQSHLRTKVVKDNSGNELATLTETTHKINEFVSLSDGTFKQVNSYRTIDLPTELISKTGPMHLSLVLQDTNGRSMPKDKAVYFTAHYDSRGQLIEVSSPKPVKFSGEGDNAIGYIEHSGYIYTLPVTKGEYQEMILA